ncbi:hypothetical protein F4777DRAFT_82488 [Nemania sp. FL0916]|nr:hypothetical protein F4777DRAFT_82488 [Nemania sp. FL0916]
MAPGNNENPNNGPQNPFAYVLIPVIGFGVIVALLTCYRYRRRKQRLARFAAEHPGRLEAGTTRHIRGPNGVIITTTTTTTTSSGGRRGGRSRRLGLGVGVGSREEGLNELGEAPPAYTADAPKPPTPGDGTGEHIELMTYSQATADAGTSRSPPEYGEAPPSSAGRGVGPSMAPESSTGDHTTSSSEETRGGARSTTATTTTGTSITASGTNEPTPPPRAVLPSS